MKNIDNFSSFHPIINFAYFVLSISLTMFYMHPVFLCISLVIAFAYSVYLGGIKAVKFALGFALPMLILVAVINPIFSHAGTTILLYVNGHPITLESIIFGWVSGVMIVSVILWFSCYNSVMSSDKFIYIFGKAIPVLSLVLSMILRFVPRYKAQIKSIATAQKCIGKGTGQGSFFARFKNAVRILSITTTWALEDGIITSDSMRARGYGLKGRQNYSIYHFYARDKMAVVFMLITGLSSILLASFALKAQFFPRIIINQLSPAAVLAYAMFLLFGSFPLLVNISEDIKWAKQKVVFK